MTETKRRLKVFLCHAHSDAEAVRALFLYLRREGVDVWLDKEKLLPGAEWELEIRRAVHESDVVVVCLSKQFNRAGFRQKEVRLALDAAMEKPDGEIFIIPARLEVCESPENLSKWHRVDLFEHDGHQRLTQALRVRAGSIGAILRRRKGASGGVSPPHKETPDRKVEPPASKSREPEKGPAVKTTAQPVQDVDEAGRLPFVWIDEEGAVWRDWEKLGSLRSTAQSNVLAYLIAHRGELCTYSSLFEAANDARLQGWVGPAGQEKIVFLSVHGIQRLIEINPKDPKLLIEVPERGYILVR